MGQAPWDPQAGILDPEILSGADAVINLNGQNIGDRRWTPAVKEGLRKSRLDATRTVVDSFRRAADPPRVLINASATGFYGDRGEELLDENSEAGRGYLSDLAGDWEKAAAAARSEMTRVVSIRLGMVVAAEGALKKMLLPFKLGAGGPIGNGRQFWPWIGIDDVCGAILHILAKEEISGPVNLVSPAETRCKDFTSTLGRVLRRPALVPLPAFAARLALGEMADDLLLASTRVRPGVLEQSGYAFHSPDLEKAIRGAIDR